MIIMQSFPNIRMTDLVCMTGRWTICVGYRIGFGGRLYTGEGITNCIRCMHLHIHLKNNLTAISSLKTGYRTYF